MTPDIRRDFEQYVDWLNPAVLVLRGSGTTYFISHAHRNQVPVTEHTPAGGDVRQGDTIWQFPLAETCDVIPLGSSIWMVPALSSSGDSDHEIWTILSITKQIWSSKWEARCRNLAFEAGLNLTVTISRAAWTKNSDGELIPAWAVAYSNVAAKIQQQDQINEIEHDADAGRRTYRITLGTSLAFDPTVDYRVRAPDGTCYRVSSYHDPDRIDQLPYLLAYDEDQPYGSSSSGA